MLSKRDLAASRFYERYLTAAHAVYDDGELFLRCFAACSPRCSLKSNVTLAERAYSAIREGRSLSDFISAHRGNLIRVRRRLPVCGPKVIAFTAALLGDENVVPVDRWILRWGGHAAPSTSAIADCTRGITALGDTWELPPARAQAVVWYRVRRRFGQTTGPSVCVITPKLWME